MIAMILYVTPAVLLALLYIWLPYLCPTSPFNMRHARGPWLVNFNPALGRAAVLRDSLLSLAWLLFGMGIVVRKLSSHGVTDPGSLAMIALCVLAAICLGIASSYAKQVRPEYGFDEGDGVFVFMAERVERAHWQPFLLEQGALIVRGSNFAELPLPEGVAEIHECSGAVRKGWRSPEFLSGPKGPNYARYLQDVRRQLGAEPQTLWLIRLSEGPRMEDGELSVMRLLSAMSRRWRILVDSNDGQFLQGQEIEQALYERALVLGFQRERQDPYDLEPVQYEA